MRSLLFSILLGTVFSVAFSAYAAAPADTPALQVTKPIYAWKTESDTDKKTGRFNHCLVKNMYDNGTVLMIAENYEGIKRLALNFPQDKMAAGEHYDLTLQVDKRDLFPVEAVAISPQILTIGIPDALPDQMRKGQAIYLRGPNDEVVYMLDGADGAVTALQDCMTTQQGHATTLQTADAAQAIPAPTATTSTNNPIVDVPPPAPIAANPATTPTIGGVATALENFAKKLPGLGEEKKIEVADETTLNTPAKPLPASPEILAKEAVTAKAMTPAVITQAPVAAPSAPAPQTASAAPIATPIAPPTLPGDLKTIFDKAGMTPTAFVSTPEKNKTSKRPLDYAWMKDSLFIGTKEQDPVPDAGMNKASVYYLKMLKDRCAGPFVAEAGNVSKTPALSWLAVEAACSPGKKDDTIAALLFANDAKHLRIYFFEAPAISGAQAIRARDTVLKTLQSN